MDSAAPPASGSNSGPSSGPTLAESIAAAQQWWRDAGVDLLFEDEPHGWLRDPAAAEAPKPLVVPFATEAVAEPEQPALRLGGDRAAWPADLPALRTWWVEEPTLNVGGLNPPISPRGDAGAALMVLVPMPEGEDATELLSAREGRLLANFALAAGIDPATLYVAAALPRHMPVPDWAALKAGGLGEVLLHHIHLAAPQRLLVMGRDILPLLGHDPAQLAPGAGHLQVEGRQVPLLATYAPARLMDHARLRAGFWQQWLDWTDPTA